MGIYMLTLWAPFNKMQDMAKITSKITKLPPYIKKWQILSTADGKKGGKSYGIIYIDDNSIAEAQLYISKVMSLYYDIEGFTWKVEPVMSQRDIVKVPGIKVE